MARVIDPSRLRWPEDDDPNPFVRYRTLLFSYHLALSAGLSDDDYVTLVTALDQSVRDVDGGGFVTTPFERQDALSAQLGFGPTGGIWVKDETSNVSGSHKARHLMGLAILLEVIDRIEGRGERDRPLAIASCGNAALAAAVVASAAERPLVVFVPTWAEGSVLDRLERLGARIAECPRVPGVAGDPTYHRLQQAIAEGAVPFTCQGPDNGLSIEGGETLAYELVSQSGSAGGLPDRFVVQVGGGALASAFLQGHRDAVELGALQGIPRFHAVQTRGGYPLARAYRLAAQRILRRLGLPDGSVGTPTGSASMLRDAGSEAIREELGRMVARRSEYMWPWEEEPQSIAHGILDDETYDWAEVVRGLLETAGFPVVVSEDALLKANAAARTCTGIDVDHTGSSGLAGVLELIGTGSVDPAERIGVLFTGATR
jgi:threonine synthase